MDSIGRINAVAYRNIQMYLSTRLSDLEIKNGQYDFFLVITLHEGISQKELSDHLCIGKSTTAKAVKNLINNGYVRKEKDAADGRLEHIYLTDKGKAAAGLVKSVFAQISEVAERGLTDSEITTLMSLLDKVSKNFIAENKRSAPKDIEID